MGDIIDLIYNPGFSNNPDRTGRIYYTEINGEEQAFTPSVYSFASGYDPYAEAQAFNANMKASRNNLLKNLDPATVASIKGKQQKYQRFQENQAIKDLKKQNLLNFYAGVDYDPSLLPDYRWAYPNGENMTIEEALMQYENIDPRKVKRMSVAPGTPVKSDAGRFFGNAQYQIGKFINDDILLNEGGTRTANWNNPRTRPGLERQREANDFVANTVISTVTAPWMLSNVATVGNLISAGEWGTLASGLAGGYIGHEVANEISVNLTGKTIEENLQRNGINAYNSAILHPGSIGGSYVGSKLYSGITNNAYSWLFNNQGSTAVSGPQGIVEVPIGEQYTFPITTTQNIGYSRNIGVPHKGTYGNHVVASGGKAAHTGKSTRWGYKPGQQVISSKTTNTDYYTNPEEPYLPTQSVIFPMGTIYNPPAPPVVPPVIQVPQVRFVETAPAVSDWEIWFGKQPENTIQWYYGTDPNHKPGPYLIKRSRVFGHERTRVGQHEGYVAPDSTTTRVVPYIPQYKVVKKEGAVSPEAEIDYNQRIRIEDADK